MAEFGTRPPASVTVSVLITERGDDTVFPGTPCSPGTAHVPLSYRVYVTVPVGVKPSTPVTVDVS